jgi:hypothetical protein
MFLWLMFVLLDLDLDPDPDRESGSRNGSKEPLLNIEMPTSRALIMAVANTSASSLLEKFSPYT